MLINLLGWFSERPLFGLNFPQGEIFGYLESPPPTSELPNTTSRCNIIKLWIVNQYVMSDQTGLGSYSSSHLEQQ